MSNGKGDSPRNCFSESFRNNFDNIFRKPEEPEPKLRDGWDDSFVPFEKKDGEVFRRGDVLND